MSGYQFEQLVRLDTFYANRKDPDSNVNHSNPRGKMPRFQHRSVGEDVEMVTSLERIATMPIVIQFGTASDQDANFFSPFVKKPFNDLPPSGIFMDFIS